jgi:cyclopropane fatty-acyl-phospholipid synthase-like methyltransferase
VSNETVQGAATLVRGAVGSEYFDVHQAAERSIGVMPAIYRTTITHTRQAPVRHSFEDRSYSWYLDLDEVFTRMWDFYLAYAEAGFRSGYLNVYHWSFVSKATA